MKTYAVIGLGQFGYQVAVSLSQKGYEVIGIDEDPEIVTEIKDLISQGIILDATDEKSMRKLNIELVDTAIVAVGTNVQSSLLITALLQQLNIGQIYVRAIEPLQENILKSMGIENIINIEKEMGMQLSNTISSGVGKYFEISDRHSIVEYEVPKIFRGETLKTLQIRERYGINIVGIKTNVPEINLDGETEYVTKMMDVPDPDYKFIKEDQLIISGTDENIQHFLSIGNSDD